jgi:hypothetical protein
MLHSEAPLGFLAFILWFVVVRKIVRRRVVHCVSFFPVKPLVALKKKPVISKPSEIVRLGSTLLYYVSLHGAKAGAQTRVASGRWQAQIQQIFAKNLSVAVTEPRVATSAIIFEIL